MRWEWRKRTGGGTTRALDLEESVVAWGGFCEEGLSWQTNRVCGGSKACSEAEDLCDEYLGESRQETAAERDVTQVRRMECEVHRHSGCGADSAQSLA